MAVIFTNLNEENKNPYEELVSSIQKIKRELGENYLDLILKKTSAINDEIIVAVENINLSL